MAVYLRKAVAVGVDKFTAAFAFKVKMLPALVGVINILKASAGLSVNGITADDALLHQPVQLAVDSSRTHRRTLSGKKSADTGDVGMLIFF